MIFNMLSKAAIKTADKLSYLRSKVSFGRWDYHPRPTVEPKTQADAVVSFLNGTLSQPITQKGRETNDAFAKRQQKHMTRSLRRLMFYLVKLDGADANSQGFNTIERTSIDALIENANNDGYTIGTTSMSTVSAKYVSPVYPDIHNVDLVSQVITIPATVTVKADSPFQTVEELIAWAKENPGKLKNSNIQ